MRMFSREWWANVERVHRCERGMTAKQRARVDYNIYRYKDTGEICYLGMKPRQICRDPELNLIGGYGRNGKSSYQCAVCGCRFGSYATVSFYPVVGAWAHRTCIGRHALGEVEAAAKGDKP